MKNAPDFAPLTPSWAVPTDADDRAWAAATREPQLSVLRNHFAASACTIPSQKSVAEIVAVARRVLFNNWSGRAL